MLYHCLLAFIFSCKKPYAIFIIISLYANCLFPLDSISVCLCVCFVCLSVYVSIYHLSSIYLLSFFSPRCMKFYSGTQEPKSIRFCLFAYVFVCLFQFCLVFTELLINKHLDAIFSIFFLPHLIFFLSMLT